ncbi:MAG: cell envelope integrity protein CreD [Chitinophagaceae bacterium]
METVIEHPAMEPAGTKSKVLLKGLIIGGLVLLLLIPTFFVANLIEEREQRQKDAISEVSSRWAGTQNISGPVLVVPYIKTVQDTGSKVVSYRHYAYFLPHELNIQTTVLPQQRSRGIYKIILYKAQANISGSFAELPWQQLKISPDKVLWNEAYVKMDVADVKGLNEELGLKWNDSLLALTPQSLPDPSGDGMAAAVALSPDAKGFTFAAIMDLNGSEQLLFTPMGKTTQVQLQAQWPHPSFTGNILPEPYQIKDSGFTAQWKSLAHKRNFPQHWTTETNAVTTNLRSAVDENIQQASFGVNLFIPVNGYQKTMRTIKYAALCILLTFAAFFLIETVYQKSVHPFQYGLIGLALVMFYVLLLSFSEYIGFNGAYAVGAIATIGLIGWFVKGLLHSSRLSTVLALVLLLVYVYVFTILQLQDFALLLGSIGLFISLAVIMRFSRKIKW